MTLCADILIFIIKDINMGRPRKYSLNENYFNKIDSSNKAYIIGFLYADGSVNKRCLSLSLSFKDIEILEFIKDQLSYGGIISRYAQKDKKYIRMSISSQKIIRDLIQVGIIPNKTYESKEIPKIDRKYIFHFLRGFFDGDGSIWPSQYRKKIDYSVAFSSNRFVLDEIKNILLDFDITSGKSRRRYPDNDISCMIDIHGNNNLEKLYHLLYDDADFFLKRKIKNL